jgi:peroxiredoxin
MGLFKQKEQGDMPEAIITLLSDGDGDDAKELGLAEDMYVFYLLLLNNEKSNQLKLYSAPSTFCRGFGVGVRSKRFVLLTKDGKASYLTEDEDGMDQCTSTSAEALIEYLSPEGGVQ